jgi:hypothetical protein
LLNFWHRLLLRAGGCVGTRARTECAAVGRSTCSRTSTRARTCRAIRARRTIATTISAAVATTATEAATTTTTTTTSTATAETATIAAASTAIAIPLIAVLLAHLDAHLRFMLFNTNGDEAQDVR